MITTAHAHKSGVIFYIFTRPFKQKKIKKLRPKMTKIASRGSVLIMVCHLRKVQQKKVYKKKKQDEARRKQAGVKEGRIRACK